MFIPNKDIEAYSRKYTFAFLIYLSWWLVFAYIFGKGTEFIALHHIYHVANPHYLAMFNMTWDIPSFGFSVRSVGFWFGAILYGLLYWPAILTLRPIRFIPYWEKPEYLQTFKEPW